MNQTEPDESSPRRVPDVPNLESCAPGQLGEMIALTADPGSTWLSEDLGGVFNHQLAAPLRLELEKLGTAALDTLREAQSSRDPAQPPLDTFGAVLYDQAPPSDLLRLIKHYAKMHHGDPSSFLPKPVATLIYYLSIASALTRGRRRITALTNAELERGMRWAVALPWIEEPTEQLIGLALQVVTKPA